MTIDAEKLIVPQLKKQLDVFLEAVEKDDEDFLCVLDGHEGSGKSKLARQIAYYSAKKLQHLGAKFDESNIFFDVKKYMNACFKDEKRKNRGTPYILDESRNQIGSATGNQKVSRLFYDYLSECRYLGGVHIVLLPASHDLKRYITMWRMKLLIKCVKKIKVDTQRWSGYKTERGIIKIYDPYDMRPYYLNHSVNKSYKYTKNSIFATFPNVEVLNASQLDQYNTNKFEGMRDKYADINEEVETKEIDLNKYMPKLDNVGEKTSNRAKTVSEKVNDIVIRLKNE